MLPSFLDRKLTSAYVRFVNYLHPTPPRQDYYIPARFTNGKGLSLTVKRYIRELVNGYSRPHVKWTQPGIEEPAEDPTVKKRVTYRIAQLIVTDAYHMKSKSKAEREYVILVVKVANDLDTFYLKVERNWNRRASLWQLSSDDLNDFKASLSEDERARL